MNSIEEKVNELLPELEDLLDQERVRKINESTTVDRILLSAVRDVAEQWKRNKSITEKALAALAKEDSRSAGKVLLFLDKLSAQIDKDLGV